MDNNFITDTSVNTEDLQKEQVIKEDNKFFSFVKSIINKPYAYLAFAFILPIVIMYLIYVSMEIHPFGDGSVLVLDLNGQYVYFFEALRNWVHGDTSILYSFSRALGGEFMGIFAYYIASPLSYIVCLFPEDMMLEGLLCLLLLKTGLCGLTFGYYLHKTSEKLNKISFICFSILYALSAYCVVQQHNTMWIDCVMWLPLVALGMEKIIKERKFKMFTFFLALSVFSNFYIGYMVCIFVAIYFFYYYFSNTEEKINPMGEKNHFIRSLFRVVGYSALACGMAMLIILTAYYSLQFGKTDFTNPSYAPKSQLDFVDLLTKFFPGSYDTVRPEGWPFVYCGVITLFLVPLYFLSKKFSAREKIASALFILFFIFSFSFNIADLVWHGFQRPNWLNYRYSFMLCFFLLILANKALAAIESVKSESILSIAAVLSIFLIIIQKLEYENMSDFEGIWMSLMFVGISLVLLCLFKKRELRENVSLIMLIFICLETFCSGLSNCLALNDDVYYSKYSSYNNFLSGIRPIVNTIKENDTSFYRFEKTKHRKTNDNMALEIRGLSNSTSTLNAETIQFLANMGYSSKSHWSKYLGGTPVSDSLLGLKYIISLDDWSRYYEEAYTEGDYTAYLNQYALSIAYAANNAVNEYDINAGDTPFEKLNGLMSALIGEEVQVFVPVRASDSTYTNMKESYIAGHYKYEVIDTSSDGTLSYYFDIPKSEVEYYFYLPSEYPREVKLKVDGISFDTFYGNETTRIVTVGTSHYEGQTMRISMAPKNKDIYVKADIDCVYYLDMDVFKEAIAKLSETQFEITDYTERDLIGTINTKHSDETILTTIPYDEGWNVYVDGEKIEYYKTLDALIAFNINDAGEHSLRIVYMPKCFIIGLSCTLVCLAIFILLCVLDFKKKKAPVTVSQDDDEIARQNEEMEKSMKILISDEEYENKSTPQIDIDNKESENNEE